MVANPKDRILRERNRAAITRKTSSQLKKSADVESWIPAFAGMTKYREFSQSVTPAKAGVQDSSLFFNGLLGHLLPQDSKRPYSLYPEDFKNPR